LGVCVRDTFVEKLTSTLGAGLSSESVKTVKLGQHGFGDRNAEGAGRHVHRQGDDSGSLINIDV